MPGKPLKDQGLGFRVEGLGCQGFRVYRFGTLGVRSLLGDSLLGDRGRQGRENKGTFLGLKGS